MHKTYTSEGWRSKLIASWTRCMLNSCLYNLRVQMAFSVHWLKKMRNIQFA
jgi:hypothetical protein